MNEGFEQTKKAALKLLAFRPRSEMELRRRLLEKKCDLESINRTITELTQSKMIDDGKFAKLYALSRVQSRAMGKPLIRRELQAKGLSSNCVAEAMRAIADVSDLESAMDFAKKKMLTMKGLENEAKKRRVHAALLRRGFEGSTVFKVLGSLLGEAEEF